MNTKIVCEHSTHHMICDCWESDRKRIERLEVANGFHIHMGEKDILAKQKLMDENEGLLERVDDLKHTNSELAKLIEDSSNISTKVATENKLLREVLSESLTNLAQIEAVTRGHGLVALADEVRGYRHELRDALHSLRASEQQSSS